MRARFDKTIREETYRIYITKSLQLAPQNQWLTKDYYDIINPDNIPDTPEKSGDEIAAEIIEKAGLTFGE